MYHTTCDNSGMNKIAWRQKYQSGLYAAIAGICNSGIFYLLPIRTDEKIMTNKIIFKADSLQQMIDITSHIDKYYKVEVEQ